VCLLSSKADLEPCKTTTLSRLLPVKFCALNRHEAPDKDGSQHVCIDLRITGGVTNTPSEALQTVHVESVCENLVVADPVVV
jgi:hypothetical protein